MTGWKFAPNTAIRPALSVVRMPCSWNRVPASYLTIVPGANLTLRRFAPVSSVSTDISLLNYLHDALHELCELLDR